MKRLITLLGATGLIFTSGFLAIACKTTKTNW
ncbi:lipoprotein [Mycoplasma mycoides]|nr:lipoprotein [Mycoplasma mycoides]QVK08778.1 lipoprotein [Mycoplasma mycoides subsp. capri]